MGSSDGLGNERYVHEVTVPTFDIARTEVTVAQYRACLEAPAGCTSAPDAGDACNWGGKDTQDHPVNCVDWYQARAFCAWAGGRLPSESKWEYAARSGGLNQIYPWGDEPATGEYVVMNEDPCYSFGVPCELLRTSSVCSRPRGNTAQGLCDMVGNVGEWLEDDYFPSYDPMYSVSSTGQGHPTDGTVWVDSPRRSWRGVRGSHYTASSPNNFRATSRSYDDPLERRAHTGFRCVR